jgi:hypothetical protein
MELQQAYDEFADAMVRAILKLKDETGILVKSINVDAEGNIRTEYYAPGELPK